MITHPEFSSFPTAEEIQAIQRQAERERALCIRGAVGRVFRAMTTLSAPRYEGTLPAGTVAGRR